MDYNFSMSTRFAITMTQAAVERRCAVVRAMAAAVEATHTVIGKRGQNVDTKPGVSML